MVRLQRWAILWMEHYSFHRGNTLKPCKYDNLSPLRQRLTAVYHSMKHHSVFRTKAEITALYFSPCPGFQKVAMSGKPKHSTVRFWRLNLITRASAIAILWLRSGMLLFVNHITYLGSSTNSRCKLFTNNTYSRSHVIFRYGSPLYM